MNLIYLEDVWLKYRIEFKENGKFVTEDFWALKGINMHIERGEVVGIIGENGAGKTTILKIIAGMLRPDRGIVKINGTISTLMEIGAGFHKDLTGRENTYLISSLFGLTKEEIETRYDDIVKFAAIGRFINAPVKVYSQGMYMRLAFAIAIHINPDILLVDDMFSVGDIYAQRKCINKIFELREQGKTIIFVTQDIEMSKRLCTRGIFIRDGIIIKEGHIDKVCGYYMESVGDKKGIAILQEGSLGLVFNNGKLIIRWKDKAITRSPAVSVMMLSLGRWYLSITAGWQVQELKEKNEVIATGEWPDIGIRQNWKITVLNEKEFLLEIISEVDDASIEKFETNFIFTDSYKDWFTLNTESSFPVNFIHEKEGEYVAVDDSIDRIIGLKGLNNGTGSFPIIVFDRVQNDIELVCHVGNTGAEFEARVIQYQAMRTVFKNNYTKGQYRCFSTKVRIFDTEEEKELRLYLADTKQIMQESKIIRKDSISLFCKDHKVEIYWQDKLITRGIGLNTRFRCDDKNYSVQDGRWLIHKENDEEIAITIFWKDEQKFVQTWRLKLEDNNVVNCEIEMEINAEIKIRQKETELVLNEEYEKWTTQDEKGGFEKIEKKGNAVLLNKYINNNIGVEEIYKTDGLILPGILFKHEDAAVKVSYIAKKEEETQTTRLRYLEIDSKEKIYIPPGKYKYFKGRIVIYDRETRSDLVKIADKKPTIIKKDEELFNKIELRRLSLIFDHGKGRLFWEETEITKDLGLYSSILSKEVWYDSSQAYWEVRKSGKGKLTAIGLWPWIPISQTWEFSLPNEKTVLWRISNETWDEVVLEKWQANLMLSNKYKEWFVYKKASGKFPDRFIQHNGVFWDRLWCGDTASPIGVKKCKLKKTFLNRQSLPSLAFSCSADYQESYSIIENTDSLFQARILQCELNPNQRNNAEENKYFDAQIKIIS